MRFGDFSKRNWLSKDLKQWKLPLRPCIRAAYVLIVKYFQVL